MRRGKEMRVSPDTWTPRGGFENGGVRLSNEALLGRGGAPFSGCAQPAGAGLATGPGPRCVARDGRLCCRCCRHLGCAPQRGRDRPCGSDQPEPRVRRAERPRRAARALSDARLYRRGARYARRVCRRSVDRGRGSDGGSAPVSRAGAFRLPSRAASKLLPHAARAASKGLPEAADDWNRAAESGRRIPHASPSRDRQATARHAKGASAPTRAVRDPFRCKPAGAGGREFAPSAGTSVSVELAGPGSRGRCRLLGRDASTTARRSGRPLASCRASAGAPSLRSRSTEGDHLCERTRPAAGAGRNHVRDAPGYARTQPRRPDYALAHSYGLPARRQAGRVSGA
jgi:hypothetical protein